MPRLDQILRIDSRALFHRLKGDRGDAAVLLGALAALAGLYSYFYVRIYSNYLLVGDDPANVAGTLAQTPLGWLTQGMKGYFHVYPEWPQENFSNFYRPIWNLVLYMENAAFGRHFYLWFLFYFAIQYLGTLLFLQLLQSLHVPRCRALFFAALFLINPAFANFGLAYPGFQFDVFASVLLLAAFLLLLKEMHVMALAFVTVAVFMKETALFAPVAAAATIFILRRDIKWSVAMSIPLFAWAAARWLAFGTVIGGTFASPSNTGALLAGIAKGAIVWPSGAVEPSALKQAIAGHFALAKSGVTFLLLAGNAILWLVLIYFAWRVARTLLRSAWTDEAALLTALLIWMFGALCFCVLAAPQTRYGAGVYAFLLLFLAYAWTAVPRQKAANVIAIIILSSAVIWKSGTFLSHAASETSDVISRERTLYNSLAALPQNGRTIYIVNAPAMYSAPEYLAPAWNLKLHIVFVNQFVGCTRSEDWHYRFSGNSLSASLPACAAIGFSTVPADIVARGIGGALSRPGIGIYRFPEGRMVPHEGERKGPEMKLGRTLAFVFDDRSDKTILAYDWRMQRYRVLVPPG